MSFKEKRVSDFLFRSYFLFYEIWKKKVLKNNQKFFDIKLKLRPKYKKLRHASLEKKLKTIHRQFQR